MKDDDGSKAGDTGKGAWNWWAFVRRPVVLVPTVIAGFAALLVNSSTILTNLRSLPGDVGTTSDQFSSWWHDDKAWTGRWTNSPEGYVDMEDMALTAEPIVIDIEVENGVIDGTIATKAICRNVPMVDFLLLRGNVGIGGRANVVAWDIVGGHKRDFAQLTLEGDGTVMTVTPVAGAMTLFPSLSKVAVDPNKSANNVAFCEGKTEARRQPPTPKAN